MAKTALIIGGGASGILTAILLAKNNREVTLLEKNDRIGKKLLGTGNGKCNLTNLSCSSKDYNTDFVAKILQKYSPARVIELFSDLGLLVRTDSEGRVYPYSESATTVLNVLMQKLGEYGVKVICDCEVKSVDNKGGTWTAHTEKTDYRADMIVIATGSDATTGSKGYKLLQPLGYQCTPLCYAIAPLLSNDIKGANGVRAKAEAAIVIDGKEEMRERGEFLFKDNAVSGVLAFRLSSVLARKKGKFDSCELLIDFLPDYTVEQIVERILAFDNAITPLGGIMHKALAQNILAVTPMDRSLIMSPAKALAIAKSCKNFKAKITGVAGRQFAQAVSGGIDVKDFDDVTLQSVKHKGLYCTGEVLDVDGLCGGYNLQWAWASAMAVGGCDGDKD